MGLLRSRGAKTERLKRFLARRAGAPLEEREALDRRARGQLFRPSAVVFSDTADFTIRVARDGILHFLMLFDRLVLGAKGLLEDHGGRIVKVEADSLLLRFPDVPSACRGVLALEKHLARANRAVPPRERLRFSYGVGWGDMLDLEEDLFGLEVNLASKLGEDLARPGEILLTPAAAAHAGPFSLIPYRRMKFGRRVLAIRRLSP